MGSLAENAGWLFGWLLRNSAHAAVLAGVVWALERTAFRRLSPRWRYGLWLLVVARLLIPIAPGSPLSLFNLVGFAPASIAQPLSQLLGLPSPVPVALSGTMHPLADTPPWFLGALALWLPGALILAALLWRDHQRLQAAIDGTPVQNSETQDLLAQSRAVMGVRHEVELVETTRLSSPAISGWLRPRILLPANLLGRLTPDEVRFLFLHELAHVKRGDIALNWILAVVQLLHWFNPFVWLALRRLLTVREEVCDDLVLRRCFQGASREYGLTLIRILEECAPHRLLPAYAGVLDDVQSLRQRVRSIRDFAVTEARPWAPAFGTVIVAVIGLTDRSDHDALSTPPLAVAEVRGHVRPALRTRNARAPRPPAPVPVQPEVRKNATSPSPAELLMLALRRALLETRPQVASASTETLVENPAPAVAARGPTPGNRGVVGPPRSAMATAPVRTSASPPSARPVAQPLIIQRAASRTGAASAGATSGAGTVRPLALPPVSQRAEAGRSARAAGAWDADADPVPGAAGTARQSAASLGSVRRPAG